MSRITIELIRKRVEHNEGEIQSVEELALHQEKIEKLENLDKWCRKLKILLLHNNLISKIENVSRLKELEYINFALNNIERIENLEGCESLKKLDLTLNFIGEISCVYNLRQNYLLETLYLTGNPCVDFPGYRKYVINALPQLKTLDGSDITTTERIQARQEIQQVEREVRRAEEMYKAKRAIERKSYVEDLGSSDEETDGKQEYWDKVTPNTPEIRREMSLRSMKLEEKSKKAKSSMNPCKKEQKDFSAFYSDGRPKNINQPKISFSLHDDQDRNVLLLDLALPRYLDSSLIHADVQPNYAKFIIKGKIFQIVLPDEVKPDSSVAQRSKTTGHLLVTMPKLEQSSEVVWKGSSLTNEHSNIIANPIRANVKEQKPKKKPQCPTQARSSKCVDWRNIIPDRDASASSDNKAAGAKEDGDSALESRSDSSFNKDHPSRFESQGMDNFDDDPNVPPLM